MNPKLKRLLTPALNVVAMAMALALTPAPRRTLSEWAEQTREVPAEASGHAGRWSNDLFPFLREIMDCLDPRHAAETVTFCKSAQVGGTEIIINWLLAIADMWPGPTLVVQPTILAAQQWVREKLSPSIKATWPPGQDKGKNNPFAEQKSRDGASTTLFKSFRRGFGVLTGANSSVDISSKSIRNVAKDEWDRWPDDVDGQGDPDALVNARQISYHASQQAKTLQVSTPANLTSSRIWRAYLAGDQRKFMVPCPHCGHEQELRFKAKHADGRGGLHFNAKDPDAARKAVYICEANGCVIEHWQKRDMLARGFWKSTLKDEERAGRQPSFHINALYSPVTTWEKMVRTFLDSKDDPQKLKAFVNLWLGEPWEDRGDAPEIERLIARRGDYKAGTIPPGGLILIATVDVQKDGVYYEVVAWGRFRISWGIDAGFIAGDTSDPDGQVWKDLAAIFDRGFPDAYGNVRHLDREGYDTGYNTNAVYQHVRKRSRAMALKGVEGWYAPPLGAPTPQDVTVRGKRKRRGIKLWPVGTWSLKSEFYSALALTGVKEGAPIDPPGYCHFTDAVHGEAYFKQITAESLTDKGADGKPLLKNGRPVSVWKAHGPNHWHDCRIYNIAIANHMGVSRMTEDEWAALAADRESSPRGVQGDFAAMWHAPLAQKTITPAEQAEAQAADVPVAPPPPAAAPEPPKPRASVGSMLAAMND